MSDYLPIMLDISQKNILLIGGGNVALHKSLILLQFKNKLTILAPSINPELEKLNIEWIKDKYNKRYLNDFQLVYACTNDYGLNQSIYNDAKMLGILTNTVDEPKTSDFISPAICQADEMIVAVSSQGTNVKKAIAWRDRIRNILMK